MKNSIVVGRNLLETITSALYENPIILFREYVQNSLDAYNEATSEQEELILTDFDVKITIDNHRKTITIKDNGYGIQTPELFKTRMLSFGDSPKTDRSKFIGFRGIGRISALPFCKTLKFKNKRKNSNIIDVCTWEGSQYRELLSDVEKHSSFEDIIQDITNFTEEKHDNNDEHFFEVELTDYGFEIEEVLANKNFTSSLTKMLPVKYADDFKAGAEITKKYNEFMNEDFANFTCSVFYNGTELKKNYNDADYILESNIIFWEIREKPGPGKRLGNKIGILWFTFNKKMVAAKDKNYGILIRSKNVLMGDNDSFADLCNSSKEHVATYSELTSTLRGTYGELLINSEKLRDNARREWFKTDENSIHLKYVIVDFMKRLYTYRYAASSFFRLRSDKGIEKKTTNLKNALCELIDIKKNSININDFCKKEPVQDDPEKEKTFADEDMPRQSQTKRKNYDELMDIIKLFFVKKQKYDIFLKLRAFIKNHFDK